MSRIRRILAVTGGLVLTGSLAGVLAAGLGMALAAAIRRDFSILLLPSVWMFGALAGAAVGGVLAPLTGWLFLRHVPLGKLVLQTTVATALVGGVGFALNFNPLIAAGIGFVGASAHLAIRTPRRKTLAEPPANEPPRSLEP
jgi:hypothetical protein